MDKMIPDLPTYENLANGDIIILVYDVFIFLLFLFNFLLYKNQEAYEERIKHVKNKEMGVAQGFFIKTAKNYDRHGMLTVTIILFVISIVTIATHHKITGIELMSIGVAFFLFFIVLYFIKRFFMGIDQFKNEVVSRSVDLVFYLILGHSFVIFSGFIETPQLPLGLVGLGFALVICFSIMLKAITNPDVIMHTVSKRYEFKESAGILKGMLALIICELGILYLMIYNCFQINPNFYSSTSSRALDTFDMLYYLMTSFATIGYGDIHPVRYNGEIYSELIAIIIAIASMYSTACFVGAVVSGASDKGKRNRERKKSSHDHE